MSLPHNKLSRKRVELMLLLLIKLLLLKPMLTRPALELPEPCKPVVLLHTTHTQLEKNGPDNQQAEQLVSLSTLMDPTQLTSTSPTELTPTEITKLLKFWAQSFQPNNKVGNPMATLTTGPTKVLLDNQDGQTKSTHGPSHLLTITTLTLINLKLCTPVWLNSKITRLINHLFHQRALPLPLPKLNKLSKPKKLPMLPQEMPLTLLRPTLSRMLSTSTLSNPDGSSSITLE
jgi:hypothetical protein